MDQRDYYVHLPLHLQQRARGETKTAVVPEVATAPGQSKLMSWVETLTSTATGYTVACVSQILIFPLYGVHLPVHQNLTIGLWFTLISIARGYVVRRAFNRIKR